MSGYHASPTPLSPEAPVFRPGEFVGREGLVGNLLQRLKRGQSLTIFGGPKLGKTSLLLHVAWQIEHTSSFRDLSVRYFDMAHGAEYERLGSHSYDEHSILLLDNCDRIIGRTLTLKTKGVAMPVLVYAGGRDWRDFVRNGGLPRGVHSVPLGMLLEHEARRLFDTRLTPAQRAELLFAAGTHPFILKMVQARMVQTQAHVDRMADSEDLLSDFYRRCVDQLRGPIEHAVLQYLLDVRQPVNPRTVAHAVGLPTIKPVADALCCVGVISRWRRNEEATVFASCSLFNAWYVDTVVFSEGQ